MPVCFKIRTASGVRNPRPSPRERTGRPQSRNQDEIDAGKIARFRRKQRQARRTENPAE